MINDNLPIRLRAWDTVNKKMHYNFQFIWIKSGDEEETPSGMVFSSDLFTPDFSKWPPEEDVRRKMAIMEWLHAVDEMSMPIYEQDLVEVSEDGKDAWVGLAMWGRKGCARCWDINKIEDGALAYSCFFDKPNTKFSVIGNTYENQEKINHLIEQGILKLPEA